MQRVYRAESELDVPVESAWRVLTDFERYAEWNAFTSRIRVPAHELVVGAWVEMRVHLGWLTLTQRERVCEVEAPNRVSWELPGPRWLLYARRTQTLTPTARGCRYTTVDTIEGVLAPVVDLLFGRALHAGFAAVADGLASRGSCSAPER